LSPLPKGRGNWAHYKTNTEHRIPIKDWRFMICPDCAVPKSKTGVPCSYIKARGNWAKPTPNTEYRSTIEDLWSVLIVPFQNLKPVFLVRISKPGAIEQNKKPTPNTDQRLKIYDLSWLPRSKIKNRCSLFVYHRQGKLSKTQNQHRTSINDWRFMICPDCAFQNR